MSQFIILDFGGQYCHLIARRIRDLGFSAEVVSSSVKAKTLAANSSLRGIILSGGANSVFEKNAPQCDKELFNIGVPVLGICYGHQLIAKMFGGKVSVGTAGEFGLTMLETRKSNGLFAGWKQLESVWMNHRDVVTALPRGFTVTARTAYSTVAAYENKSVNIFGVQFHPEVSHTKKGDMVLRNFVQKICRGVPDRSSYSLLASMVEEARDCIGSEKAIIGLSGGVDSSVAAVVLGNAIGKNLVAVYVDTGLMRDRETEFIKRTFAGKKLTLKIVHAEKRFFKALKGVTSPEKKRKTIGKLFVDIFYEEARKMNVRFLVQGTIYSDRIESGLTKHSSKIKSHHNVGGLPINMKLRLYEPLRELYKDEVRALAKQLRLPQEISNRQVFPGPGLAVRILGEVTQAKVTIVRKAGAIIEEELYQTRYWKKIWMSFPILLPIKSVGVQGDERSYKFPIVLRVIESRDVMTANFSHIPYSILEKISSRITNEIQELNRVVYDITNKPPGTMEWE